MSWVELHATTSSDYANTLSAQLELLGACAVTFQDAGDHPIFEPNYENPELWRETTVTGLFDETAPLESIIRYFEEIQAQGFIKNFSRKNIADQDWARACLDQFKPLRFGKRLYICPSWETPENPAAINVILDPGLAFGTGTHPTTRLCLEWLEKNIHGGETLIDYGCGSGILAIAALKLGAKKATAVDCDPQALLATEQNAKRNAIGSDTLCIQDISSAVNTADILIANILANPLIELASTFSTLVKPGGKIVLSGILANQLASVSNTFQRFFHMFPPTQKEGWGRLTGIRVENNLQ